MDADHAADLGLGEGKWDARIGDTAIGARPIKLIDWIEADIQLPDLPGPILGVLGNDFFREHAVGLDHRSGKIAGSHSG